MKKFFSLFLTFSLFLSCISSTFSVQTLAEQPKNLLKNGDFQEMDSSGATAANWNVYGTSFGVQFHQADSSLPTAEQFNYVTFTPKSGTSGETMIYNHHTVAIEKNTTYTITFWVKNNNCKGFRYFLYEPEYIDKDGKAASSNTPNEGQNNYSYAYLNNTRVIREDITHTIQNITAGESLRSDNYSQLSYSTSLFAPNNQNQWVKIQHTFTTGNVETHIANVRCSFGLRYNSDNSSSNTFSIGGISMTAVKHSEEQNPTKTDFEDLSKWGKCGNNSKNVNGCDGYVAPESYVTLTKQSTFVKTGTTALSLNCQWRGYYYKLDGLKSNTAYGVSFSYAAPKMSNGSAAQTHVLAQYGIFNSASSVANMHNPTHNATSSCGYLNYCSQYLTTYGINEDGKPTTSHKGIQKTSSEQANTWYDTVTYFNTGSSQDTLYFVIYAACNPVYIDDISLFEIKSGSKDFECFAPAVSGVTRVGSYDTDTATTHLYENCTESNYTAYLSTLEEKGFAKHAENASGQNKFATYTKGTTTVHVTYTPNNKTIRISEQITDTLPQTAAQNSYTSKNLQPLIIQLNHVNVSYGGIGMSYIMRLADGSYIIVDGGDAETYFENADRLYNLLRQYTPTGEINIAAWLFTHNHEDHISGFMTFIQRYNSEINIEQLIYNFATFSQYDKCVTTPFYADYRNFKAYVHAFTNAKISTCHTGYQYHIRNAVVDVMFTLEDLFPQVIGTNFTNINNTSTVFKISFTDENVDQTLLTPGDAGNEELTQIEKMYLNGELSAYFVQVVHHGIGHNATTLYKAANPTVALWPTSAKRLHSVLCQTQNQYLVNTDSIQEIALSDYGTRVFALPYTAPTGLTKMNKFTLPGNTEVQDHLLSYVGVSIRKAGEKTAETKQALRFKFQIPNEIIEAQTEDGYTVSEYGMMVAETELYAQQATLLNYYSGTADKTVEDGKTKIKAIAYHKKANINTVFDYVAYTDLTDDSCRSVQFTAALYNIGVSNTGTNYQKYDTSYSLRPYIVFENSSGDTKVYYGDVQKASVFEVMLTALKSGNEDDKTYVQNFLSGKIDSFAADSEQIATAWNANENRKAVYNPTERAK